MLSAVLHDPLSICGGIPAAAPMPIVDSALTTLLWRRSLAAYACVLENINRPGFR